MGNDRTRIWLRSVALITFLFCCFFQADAAFYVKSSNVIHSAHLPVVAEQTRNTPIVQTTEGDYPQPGLLDVPAADDGYKGILALVFGGSSILMLLIAFIAPSVIGLIVPAFFVGIGGIVFGAMRKKQNRALGRAGLVMGIIGVAAIILFVAAVLVALASFT